MAEIISGITDAGFSVAVAEESATILWAVSGRVMRRHAEAVKFRPGGRWDEQAMGTNAVALAAQSGRPAVVFAAEHLVEALHDWVGYCAPICSPNGRVLGVIALSTTWDRANTLALPTTCALASTIESRLRSRRTSDTPPPPTSDISNDLSTGIEMTVLGQSRAAYNGDSVSLTPRQMEILTLLALQPAGYSPSALAIELYGDRQVSINTLKVEISHLRRLVEGQLTSRHYALTAPVACDAATVMAALEQGDPSTALRLYRGPLLPDSDAPGIVEWRDRIEVALRSAVLASARPEHALSYGAAHPDDLQIHEHALRHLGAGDRRRPIAAARRYAALNATD